ncbi:HTH-type transcriptional regulator RpiR [Streptococcus pluranimalium]
MDLYFISFVVNLFYEGKEVIELNTFYSRMKPEHSQFSDSDKQIIAYLVANLDDISNSSIHDLAKKIKVSSSTLSRFTKKIGYDSFQDFKLDAHKANMEKEISQEAFFGDIDVNLTNKENLNRIFYNNINSLKSTAKIVSEENFQKAVELISESSSFSFFGLGGSNAVAAIAYHKFLRTSLNTRFHTDFHYQQMIASTLTSDDCALVISHSGQNRDTLKIVDILKQNKVRIIGITSHIGSQLSLDSDVAFISSSDEISFRPEAVSSTVSQISIIDALFLIYGLRHQDMISPTIAAIRHTIRTTRKL